jgi:hypothetical protein
VLQNKGDFYHGIPNHVLNIQRWHLRSIVSYIQKTCMVGMFYNFKTRIVLFRHWPVICDVVDEIIVPVQGQVHEDVINVLFTTDK